MTDRNNLKVICLDFDGVVVDSNSIKSMAFIEIFEPYQDKILEIKKFQEENTLEFQLVLLGLFL